MSTILDLPEVRKRVSLISVAAYETLAEMGFISERAELSRGVVIEKMSRSPLHRDLTKAIFKFFLAWESLGFVAFIDSALRLRDSKPEPDVMIVRGTEGEHLGKDPTTAELVIEVALTSVALGRENAALYAEAGVKEYWIVLANEKQVEVYRQPTDGTYRLRRTYTVGEKLVCESIPGLEAPLSDWFAA